MNKNILIILVSLLFNFGYGQTNTWTGATSTAWQSGLNWSLGVAPLTLHDVVIPAVTNQPVISTSGITCATLTLGGGSNLTINTSGALTVVGGITISAPSVDNESTILNVVAGSLTASEITMGSGANDTRKCSLIIGTGTANIAGSILMTGLPFQNDVNFSGAGTLNIGGTMVDGSLFANAGLVNYNGLVAQTVAAYVYHNLSLSGAGIKTFNDAVTVNNTLSIGLGIVADLGTYSHAASSLSLNGVNSATGTWGGTGSGAININPTFFVSNTGVLNVGVPTIQATNVIFTSTTQTSTTANWTNGSGTSRAIFIRAGLSASALPVDYSAYAANIAFGTGTQIGTTGWFCVYNGTGTTVNITGLNPGTTYQLMAIEYNGISGTELYQSAVSTGNPFGVTTLSATAGTIGPGGVVTGLNLWLDATTGITISTGTQVNSWSDRSDSLNNATQAASVNQPTVVTQKFNFNPALQLDGVNQYMNLTAIGFSTGATARSVFFVASENGKTGTNGWIISYGVNSGSKAWCPGKLINNTTLFVSGYSKDAFSSAGFWPSPVNNNVPKLGGITYSGTVASFYDAGNSIGTSTINWPTGIGNGYLGAFVSNAERWKGNIAEVVYYSNEVSATDREKIESYLALKYGVHKTGNFISSSNTVFWDATLNAAYHNDVFGLGQDDTSGLTQSSSNSMNTGGGDGTGQTGKGNIIISNPSSLVNNGFLIIGHDTSALAETNVTVGANSTKRVQRIWKAQTTGNPGTVSLTYDITGLTYSGQIVGDYTLLVDPTGTGDFNGGTVVKYPAASLSANKVLFNTVSLPTGAVFTFQTLGVPTVQATDIAFSGTTSTATTASWTNGDGSSRLVFIHAGTTTSPLPIDLTTYTANPSFGGGTQIGLTGWFCVYKGTGTSVNISGLTPATSYQVMALEYNGTTGNEIYLSTVSTENPAMVTTNTNSSSPVGPGGATTGLQLWLDASNGLAVTGSNLTAWTDRTAINTFAVSATPPILNNNAINFHPTVAFNNGAISKATYPATQNLIGNTSITYTDAYAVFKVSGTNGGTVIGSTVAGSSYGRAIFSQSASRLYTGNGNSSTFSSFSYTDFTNFNVFAMEKNSSTTIIGRLDAIDQVMNNQGTYSSISFIPTVGTTNNNGNASGWSHLSGEIAEVVLYSQSAGLQKINIESYLALKYGIHKIDNYVSSTNTIVWDATVNALYDNDVFGIGIDDLSGLSQSISNSMNTGGGDGTGQSGKGNIVLSNPTSLANNGFLVIGHNTGALAETDIIFSGNHSKRVQRIWKAQATGNPGNVTLSYDITGLGYSGQSASDYVLLVDPTGLGVFDGGSVVKYTAALLTGNKATFNAVALPTGAVFTFQTLATPTLQATNVVFTAMSATTTTVNWTNGGGSSRAVFMFAGASGSALPIDLTAYTANPVFGTGTQIGTTGWFCVYNGTGTTVNITGLTPLTTYQVMTVEYNGATAVSLYLSTIGTGNPSGVTTLNNIATLSNLSISQGTLTPVFVTGTTTYTANVANAVTSLTVTPTATDPNATVTVNGIFVLSGNPSEAINLDVGPNVITTVVTAQDGTTLGTYIITVTRTAPATIVTTGTVSALSTVYGTASTSGTFNVSGTDMLAGILVTAPSGFEVSTDNVTFTNTVTVGALGIIASTPVYIRLKASSPAGSYLGDLVLSSAGATTVNFAIVSSTVTKAPLTITAVDKTKTYGDVNPALTVNYTGFVNGDTEISLTTAASSTTTATTFSGIGTYPITPGGAVSSNYAFTYVNANLTITTAFITFTADDKTRVYGAANPVFTGTYDGFVNGDTESSITTPPVFNTVADATSAVGDYPIIPSGAVSPNYVINYVFGNLEVTKATLTITADAQTKIYGEANPSLTATYSGFANGETVLDLTTAPTITTTAALASAVGTYPIVASGAAAANYTINYVDGSLTITKATLTVTAVDKTKVYGDANPALTVTYSGFVNGETVASLLTPPTIATTAALASPVGTYTIVASGGVDPNYAFIYVDGNLTVTVATLTVTAVDKTKVYGAVNPALTVSYAGFVNGQTELDLLTLPTVTTSAVTSSPVGSYPIVVLNGSDPNYTFNYVDGTLTVTPITLTITAENKTKIYGDTNPILTVSYAGFVNGDTAASLTTAPTITTTAATASAVGTYPIVASAAVDTNYAIVYVDGTLTVTKATLTVTADDKNKVYGDANPALTISYTGFANGDTEASLLTPPAISTTALTASPVGTYPITVNGASDPNYIINYVNGTLTVSATTLLTIVANNQSKTYGDVNPTLTVSYVGFVNGDTETDLTTLPTISTTALQNSPAGTYPVTASGAVSANYTISYTDGILTVNPAALIVTADAKTKVYGDANPALTVSYSGFANGDSAASLTTAPTITTTADATSPVGGYPITASGAVNPNYTITYVAGNFAVTAATLTITADNQTKVYGDANPALTVSYVGFVNGDSAASLTTAPSITTTATTLSPVGTYVITASGAVNSNYTINYTNGTLSITPVTLTITADNQSKFYGDVNPALTVSYAGFVNGDTAASLTTAPTITTTADATSPVGTYPITPSGAVDNNYTIVYTNGTLTVNPAALTITADAQTKVYGSANPLFTASYTGFVNGDTSASLTTQPIITTIADATSPVGAYPIVASGAVNNNYTITYVNGSLTVTAATITVTAVDKTKVYGDVNPALTATYSGFVNSQTESDLLTLATIATTAATASPVGTYPIVASGASDPNYTFSYVDGTLTVTAATLTVTGVNKTKVYGDVNPTLTATYSGFVNGETESDLLTLATIATTAATASPVGTYPIVVSGAADPNYTFNYVDGNLTVTVAILTVTAENKSKVYGDANPALTVTYSGFVNGETVASLLTPPTIATTAALASPVGSYPIVASGGIDPNYTFNYVDGNLTVTAATLTVTAENKSKVYGDANPALTASFAGFVNGDTSASLTTQPTITTTVDATSPVGVYPITASGAVDTNYTISYVNGDLTVTAATLTITADAQTKTYGSANPTLTVSYTGFVNGDTSASLTTQPTIITTADATSPVGVYQITASGAVDANYTINYVNGDLTVTAATLIITADAQTKTYGSANPTLTVSYTGFVNGDTSASLTTQPNITTITDATSPVGVYPITASGAVDANYTINYVNGDLTVTAATLTITADAQTKTYGSANPTLTANYSGFVNGDTSASLTTQPNVTTIADATSPVGVYAITASGAVDTNYTISYVNGDLTVTAATLTITADAQTKTYGSANPTLTASYTGFVNGDTSVSLTTQPNITSIADATSPVGVYAITASGAVDANYTISYVNGDLTVTAATLTITADNQIRDFGEANPTLTATYIGFVNGDTVASLTTLATVTTTADITSPVGTYPITASGALATNYTFTYVTGTLTVMPLTDASLANLSVSEGTLTPVFAPGTTNYTVEVPNATTSLTITPVTNDSDATVIINGVPVISGNASGAIPLAVGANTITVVVTAQDATTTETYTITVNRTAPATIATTGTLVALSTTYGTASATDTFNVSGTDMLSGILVTAPSGFEVSTDGITFTNTLTVGAAGTIASTLVYIRLNGTIPAGNYAGDVVLTSTGATTVNVPIASSTVTPATLTITANDANRLYGAADPAFSTSVAGFVNGDTNAIITNAATVTSNATNTSPIGNYVLTPAGAVLSSSNYTIVYVNGNLAITNAILTITADAQTKTYGAANPTLTASYSGFVNGDTAASLTTLPTITTLANTASSVGNYTITASGAVSSNYTIIYADGNLAVTPAALTITSDNQTKVYGSPNPTFTSTYTGFVNGDTASSLTTQPTVNTPAVTGSPVGTYLITDSGAANPNYTISYVTGNLTVTAAPLTITADNKTRAYDAANPPLTASYTGFVNGETTASLTTLPTIATLANATSPVGVYAITVSGAVDPNYAITYVTGVLTVTAPSDVDLSSITISSGVLTPAFSPNVLSYNVAVGSNITTETISVVADDPLDKITINGVPVASGGSSTVSLASGVNTFVVKVTSEDGSITKSYILTITKDGADVATLSNLTISKGVLDPKFKSDITNYDAVVRYDVNSITVTPTATDSKATITVNGIAVASTTASTPIVLQTGENIIETVVTAEDGITKEIYAIIVYKGLSPDALVINNILSPNGDGKNDFWIIKDIELFPNNKVTVFDRAGRIVYSKNSYNNEWDGSYGGSPLNNDTYYYLIDLGDNLPKIKGFITMIRD